MKRPFLSMGLLFLAGCSSADPAPLVIAPSQGAMSGYYEVRVETPLDVEEVRLGGIRGFDLRAEDGAVVFTVQGHPEPGSVALELTSSTRSEVFPDAFEYLPAEPGFERLVAMGASLSQGVQGGVPTQHGQRHSPSRFIQANLFIDQINEVMGANLEPVDLAVVYETDEHRPEALLEQGLDPACLP